MGKCLLGQNVHVHFPLRQNVCAEMSKWSQAWLVGLLQEEPPGFFVTISVLESELKAEIKLN